MRSLRTQEQIAADESDVAANDNFIDDYIDEAA
jgi:hypothetical protein